MCEQKSNAIWISAAAKLYMEENVNLPSFRVSFERTFDNGSLFINPIDSHQQNMFSKPGLKSATKKQKD